MCNTWAPCKEHKLCVICTENNVKALDKIRSTTRHTKRYKVWRQAVLLRDNYTCVLCKKEGNHVDHYPTPWCIAKHLPELAYDMRNGRCLCAQCHAQQPTTPEGLRKKLSST